MLIFFYPEIYTISKPFDLLIPPFFNSDFNHTIFHIYLFIFFMSYVKMTIKLFIRLSNVRYSIILRITWVCGLSYVKWICLVQVIFFLQTFTHCYICLLYIFHIKHKYLNKNRVIPWFLIFLDDIFLALVYQREKIMVHIYFIISTHVIGYA